MPTSQSFCAALGFHILTLLLLTTVNPVVTDLLDGLVTEPAQDRIILVLQLVAGQTNVVRGDVTGRAEVVVARSAPDSVQTHVLGSLLTDNLTLVVFRLVVNFTWLHLHACLAQGASCYVVLGVGQELVHLQLSDLPLLVGTKIFEHFLPINLLRTSWTIELSALAQLLDCLLLETLLVRHMVTILSQEQDLLPTFK